MRRAILIALNLAVASMLAGCFGGETWRPSPIPHPPEWDVWVNGNYVGTDPDPRIRATLRNEARESHNLR